MNFVAVIMGIFSVLAGIDRIFGNRFGLGKEFEKGFMLFGTMALSMIGMIILSPALADLMRPVLNFMSETLHIDPSILPAALFANDMGGAPLAVEVATDEKIGLFNALVVAAMMGATVSFTIPYALGIVKEEQHKELLLGLLCGIVTIPVGCLVSGFLCEIPLGASLMNLLPLVVFSGIIACGLIFAPNVCVKIFGWFGKFMRILITVGLILGIVRFLTGKEILSGLATLEEGAAVCLNASVVMSGAFPLMYLISKLCARPLKFLGGKIGINETSAMGLVSSLATSVTTFEMMSRMDKKGAMINSAFAVSAAFTFAGHLAFTLAFDARYIPGMIVGKLVAGGLALLLAVGIYHRLYRKETATTVKI